MPFQILFQFRDNDTFDMTKVVKESGTWKTEEFIVTTILMAMIKLNLSV
jgi:hypothetical protein